MKWNGNPVGHTLRGKREGIRPSGKESQRRLLCRCDIWVLRSEDIINNFSLHPQDSELIKHERGSQMKELKALAFLPLPLDGRICRPPHPQAFASEAWEAP